MLDKGQLPLNVAVRLVSFLMLVLRISYALSIIYSLVCCFCVYFHNFRVDVEYFTVFFSFHREDIHIKKPCPRCSHFLTSVLLRYTVKVKQAAYSQLDIF